MLLTFEGIDGSGKSTQARLLAERLEAVGRNPLLVREPGGTELSERVRALLLDRSLHIVPFAEMLLFSAARAQLVAERLRPALSAGRVVVCDRFYDSTTAYQGAGRGVEAPEWLHGFNRRVVGGLVPDRTYLLDISPEKAQSRRTGRTLADGTTGDDRMEAAGLGFQERVAEAYRDLARDEPGRYLVLDGGLPVDELERRIWTDAAQLLARNTDFR